MVSPHRFSTTALIVCLALASWSGTLVASQQPPLSPSVINAIAPGQEATSAVAVSADVIDEQSPRATEGPTLVERSRLTFPDEIFRETSPRALEGNMAGSLAQRGGYRGRGRGGRNDAARAAVVLGAVAAIAGTSVLVYANRPECSVNARAGGCGYGTKVVGTAVLSGGIVGLLVGALTWR
jgi:hypothetical protein